MKNLLVQTLAALSLMSALTGTALASNYGMTEEFPTVQQQIDNPPAHNYGMEERF